MGNRIIAMLAAASLFLPEGGAIAASGHSEGAEETTFVALDPMTVPIVESDRIAGTLRVTVVIEAVDAAAAERLTGRLPEIRQVTMATALEFARLHASGFRPVNAELLHQELKAAFASSSEDVAQVLITEVSARSA